MPTRLADRLHAARHDLFVGREAERELFRTALEAAELPFVVLYICGLGGVGKSTLLRELAMLAERHGAATIAIDGRNIEPTPAAFLEAAGKAAGLEAGTALLPALSARTVLLVDTYELLTPLDNWLREDLLPQLTDNVLVILAGRTAPSLGWRGDGGWRDLVRIAPLRNLSPADSRAYLARRDVPDDQHQAVLDFTHGHPLALSLVADVLAQRPATSESMAGFDPEAAPDVVKVLLEHLVQQVPSERHRAALEACALVRLTTEELLAAMLDQADVHEVFEWLRGLSFVEMGRPGLFPHDLAREALLADLRWRNPDRYAELHRRAREYYSGRLRETHGTQQERILFDYIFLHRANPVVRPFLEWQESGTYTVATARPDEIEALTELVARHEGLDAARLAGHWFARQPQHVIVLHESGGAIAGFLSMVYLHDATPQDLQADPATTAAWNFLQGQAPLRPGEGATYFRFWMAHDTYQAVSSVQSLVFVTIVRHYLTTPGLAYTFFACAEPDFWTPVMQYADARRVSEIDFQSGGRAFGVFSHDWRTVPPVAWLALLAEREIASDTMPVTVVPTAPTVLVLSQPEFAEAVHQALRHMARPAALRGNPLLRSRLIVDLVGVTAGDPERIAALQQLLAATCATLDASPRDSKFYRALDQTYLHPAPTQEDAADRLDIPFSTFRRHLKTGIERITESLWQREVTG